MPFQMQASVRVFAYGSNMCTERIRARAASAAPLATGYVNQHRLAFHKRGKDGSAKANAVYTGCISDRIWGVVFSMKRAEAHALDGYEFAYDRKRVVVLGNGRVMRARMYVARADAIDGSLKPYAWYYHYVWRGALQHSLPPDYVQRLQLMVPAAEAHGELLAAGANNASSGCGLAAGQRPAFPRPARRTPGAGIARRRGGRSARDERRRHSWVRDARGFTCQATAMDRARCGWPTPM